MKLIISDLDGTLIDQNHAMDPETVEKIKAWCAAGNLFMIATGRLDADVLHIETQLGTKGKFRISQNGCVIRNERNETVKKHTIRKGVADALVDLLFDDSRRVEVNTDTNRHFPSLREEQLEIVETAIVIPNLAEHTKAKLEPTIFLISGTEDEFLPIIERVEGAHGEDVT
ncbi:MAG: HAD family hydrolase, partial [Bacilli bacterium]